MSDNLFSLSERLRKRATQIGWLLTDPPQEHSNARLMRDAADRIEELERQLREARRKTPDDGDVRRELDELLDAHRASIVAWFDARWPDAAHIPHPDRLEPQAWETFRDPTFCDLWAVHPVGETRFDTVFHVPSPKEAEALVDVLMGRGRQPETDKPTLYETLLMDAGASPEGARRLQRGEPVRAAGAKAQIRETHTSIYTHPSEQAMTEAIKRFERIADIIKRNLWRQNEKVEDAKQLAIEGAEALKVAMGAGGRAVTEAFEQAARIAESHIGEHGLSDNPAYVRYNPADLVAKKIAAAIRNHALKVAMEAGRHD